MSREFDLIVGEVPQIENLLRGAENYLPGVCFYRRDGTAIKLNRNKKPGERESEDDYFFGRISSRKLPTGASAGGTYNHPAANGKYSTYTAPTESSAQAWEADLKKQGFTED